jgi:PAS domain S-box-containing protein
MGQVDKRSNLKKKLAMIPQPAAGREEWKVQWERAWDALQKAYDDLEQRIEERTAELVRANQHLVQEIEERKKTEAELKRTKDYLENVINNSVDAIGIADRHGRMILWNRRAEEIYGYTFQELAGKTAFDLYAYPGELERLLTKLRHEGVVREYEIAMKKSDGSIVPMDISISLLKDDQGETIGSVCVARDLSERKKNELELKRARDELRRYSRDLERQVRERTRDITSNITELKKAKEHLRLLSGSIMARQEKERAAISRELHDELGQVLTALRMDAVWLSERLKGKEPPAASRASAMCDLIDATIDEVRALATRLRPGVLDDFGLIDALDWYTKYFAQHTGITCKFKHPDMPPVDDLVATAAYRIAQEALTNVARHAFATQVKIDLQVKGGVLILSVADNGRGFNPQKLADSHCLGLAGMRERASLVGGSLEMQTKPGKGTRVYFRLPLEERREALA